MKTNIYQAISELRRELYLVTKEDLALYTNGQLDCEEQIDDLIKTLKNLKEEVTK